MPQPFAFVYRVELPGQPAYVRAIQRFADKIEDWTDFWNDFFRDAWYRHVQAHYETQGAATGMAWPSLSERYGLWKQKHWPGMPIGVLSGATRESLTFADDPNAVWRPQPDSLQVGTAVPYAIFLQVGTRKMPARPPLRVNDEFMLLMGQLMQQFAVKVLRESGLEGEA